MVSEVKVVTGRGIPLPGNDIDTDRIIPARFLRCVTFDQPPYQGAEILVVNGNFGCGSSREHAPQAIAKWGIRAIVGESFAEIFFGNCLAMGIPCVTADATTVKILQEKITADPQSPVTVNLETMQVQSGNWAAPVSMHEGPRSMLVAGTWDACGQLVAQAEQIRARAATLPYVQWSSR